MFSLDKAHQKDIPELLALLAFVRESLEKEGNFMWSGAYPDQDDFLADISAESLYLVREEGKIIGAGALSYDPLEAFYPVSLSREKLAVLLKRVGVNEKTKIVILHRLMVLPRRQHEGVASFLLEKLKVQEKGATWLFAVFPGNQKALAFYPRLGFQNLGIQLFEYGDYSSQILFCGRFN